MRRPLNRVPLKIPMTSSTRAVPLVPLFKRCKSASSAAPQGPTVYRLGHLGRTEATCAGLRVAGADKSCTTALARRRFAGRIPKR